MNQMMETKKALGHCSHRHHFAILHLQYIGTLAYSSSSIQPFSLAIFLSTIVE